MIAKSSKQKQFSNLRDIYLKQLPKKLSDIEAANDHFQKNHLGPRKLDQFRRSVHSLSGSAGTYGFDELSQTAHQIEVLLIALKSRENLNQTSLEEINSLSELTVHNS